MRCLRSVRQTSVILLILISMGPPAEGAELEVIWSSTYSDGQWYPSPNPAIADIRAWDGVAGAELVRYCPAKGDWKVGAVYHHAMCVRPDFVPMSPVHAPLFWAHIAVGGYPVHCGDCNKQDQFGIQRCTPDQTYYCATEQSLWDAIEARYANECGSWEVTNSSGWNFLEFNSAGALSDGTALYEIEHLQTYTIEYPTKISNCDPGAKGMHTWGSESHSFEQCPTGYYSTGNQDPNGGDGSCSHLWYTSLQMLGAEEEQTSGCGEGNPCHPTNGAKSLNETDFVSPTLELTRHFLSKMLNDGYAAMGRGWSHSYSERIQPLDSDSKRHLSATGDVERFHCTDAPACTTYRAESKSGLLLTPTASGWELLTPGGTLKSFDSEGKLTRIERRSGTYSQITITYTIDDQVDQVIDQQGRSLVFAYNADGLVESIALPSGEMIQYQYERPAWVPSHVGWNQRLVKVISEDLTERIYHYEDQHTDGSPRHDFLVTGITDEKGVRWATYTYDDAARVTSSGHALGAGLITLNYTKRAGETENWTITEVTQPLGEVKTYAMQADPFRKPTAISDSRGDYTMTYDPATKWRSSRTDREGHQTSYVYADGFHETRRTEAVGTSDQRVIETDWDNTINRMTERREPGKKTTYTYNTRGQVLTRTETDINTLATRTWTYTYFEVPSIPEIIGQLETTDGPRTDVSDVTTYAYYTSDDPGGAYLKGDLHTVTNALGHITEYLAYDDNGRPLQVKDANNIVTTMSYHSRGWIQNRTTDGQTTSFSYDDVGNLTRVTQPDGSTIDYEYDDAHRLDAIADNYNNRIEYTLDAAGNRTVENTYNDLGILRRQMSRVYDQLSRLEKMIDGNLDETLYGYDNNGNRTSSQDPNLNTTSFEYDPLDRLVRTIDAALNDTLMDYDERDNLTSVTDPLGNVTTYFYDGLDNQTQLDSPDTGVTTYEYDDAGNRTAATDARGVRVEYSYDALNRLTLVDYVDNSLDVTFTYDVGVNAKGRLSSMDDAAGTESYTYDARGNLISVVRDFANGPTYTTSYSYNGADRLTQIVYPSGMVVDYVLDATGRIVQVDESGSPLITSIEYEPFGPVSDFIYGNGLTMSATFDVDYELDQLQSGFVLDWVYGYDDTGNILSIADQLIVGNSQSFTYDDLYRLDTASGAYGTEDFDYDANGNRTRYQNGMVDEPYAYQPQSNQLTNQNGWTFNRDAAGNRLDKLDGTGHGKLYHYGEHNRLDSVSDRDAQGDTVLATYVYDGRGQRVQKITQGGISNTYYVYGRNGELLGEYGTNAYGPTIVEYIYLNGQPVAVETSNLEQVTPPPTETIIDNGDAGTSHTGSWNSKTDVQQYGSDYQEGRKSAGNTYRWLAGQAGVPTAQVYAWWVDHNSYSSQVEYTISYAGGTQSDVVTVSHQNGGGQWQYLGEYYFWGTPDDYVEVSAANGKTSADAIRFVTPNDPLVMPVDATHFIHADHLGTPRAVTDDAQTVIWRWDSRPFGDSGPDEDPDGDSNDFRLNLRFPGQYFDQESGLHYNYFRDYDPTTGRYIESDPIGLDGGINTFAYVGNGPLAYYDIFGLIEDQKADCIYLGTKWINFTTRFERSWEERKWVDRIPLPRLGICGMSPGLSLRLPPSWGPSCSIEWWALIRITRLWMYQVIEKTTFVGTATYECKDNCTGESYYHFEKDRFTSEQVLEEWFKFFVEWRAEKNY